MHFGRLVSCICPVFSAWLLVGCGSLRISESAVDTFEIPGTHIQFRMVLLPGGDFSLGSDPDEPGRDDDEGPRRRVSVDSFWIGEFEVTYDEWVIFQYRNRDTRSSAVPGRLLDVDAVARPSPPYEDPSHGLGGPGRPAVGMTQWGALRYARWLSDKTGIFFRLPTEAEWEYACRAGSVYDIGESDSEQREYAWFESNSDGRMHAVGSKRPNAWGLYDMLGNVAEWTLDQYEAGYYDLLVADAARNPWRQPTRLHPRTVRGGAYDDPPGALRCAGRIESSLSWKRRDPQIPKSIWWNTDSPFVGFRLVRPAMRPSAEEREDFWSLVLGGIE